MVHIRKAHTPLPVSEETLLRTQPYRRASASFHLKHETSVYLLRMRHEEASFLNLRRTNLQHDGMASRQGGSKNLAILNTNPRCRLQSGSRTPYRPFLFQPAFRRKRTSVLYLDTSKPPRSMERSDLWKRGPPHEKQRPAIVIYLLSHPLLSKTVRRDEKRKNALG